MKVAITGISSYLASAIVPFLEKDDNISEILGIDLVEPKLTSKKIKFAKRDVRDKSLAEDLKGCEALIHLAFIVSPLKHKKEIYSINVDGSKNVFDCALASSIKKIIHASSVAAYGSFLDNPVPIVEMQPVRLMRPKFYYNATKYIVEKYLDELEKAHPEVVITRLRPHIFLGPNINNHFQRSFKGTAIMSFFPEQLSQYAWVEDVAQAFYLALVKDAPGAFNIAGDNPLSDLEIAKRLGKKCGKLPYKTALFFFNVLYKSRIQRRADPGWIRCARYPIIVDSSKAKEVLGWKPKYDTFGTIQAFIAYQKVEDEKRMALNREKMQTHENKI